MPETQLSLRPYRGEVFHSDKKSSNILIFLSALKVIFASNHKLYFLSPIGGGDSTVSQASCAVFYSDTRAPGAVFYSDTSPYRGGDSTVSRASCTVYYQQMITDGKLCLFVVISSIDDHSMINR